MRLNQDNFRKIKHICRTIRGPFIQNAINKTVYLIRFRKKQMEFADGSRFSNISENYSQKMAELFRMQSLAI